MVAVKHHILCARRRKLNILIHLPEAWYMDHTWPCW